jgi:HK97 gp10 family phage protein
MSNVSLNANLNVPGLSDLFRQMDALPLQLQKSVMRGAMRAGQKVIMTRARAGVPVNHPSAENTREWGSYMGALRDSIKISTRIDRRTGQAVAKLTAGNYKAFYARWVEFGTKPHEITSKFGRKVLGTPEHPAYSAHHPGARKNPFMRIAIDSGAQEAAQVVAQYIGGRLAELFKLPDEGDS